MPIIKIKNKRFLQLGKFFPIRGGVEKVMYELMIGLSEIEVHCDMLCASAEGKFTEKININPYSKLFIESTKIKLASTTIAPGIIKNLRKIANNYSIIHIHHPDPMVCLALFLSGYKGKVILHWHSDIFSQKLLLKLYNPLQKWLIKRADIIVGTSPVYVQSSPFLKEFQHKTDYIPIGVNSIIKNKKKVDEIKEKFKNKHLIFSLGRLVEYKGYEYLIRSAIYLNDSYHIVIAGKGILKESLEQLITELNVSNRVSLIGFISDENAANYFHACDLFVLSSIYKTEAFGIVQIEAMSCRKPIISTNISGSGVSWVNKNNISGIVVEKENPKELSDAIIRICTDRILYKKLCKGSKQRYEENFSRKKMIEKCLDIYSKILE